MLRPLPLPPPDREVHAPWLVRLALLLALAPAAPLAQAHPEILVGVDAAGTTLRVLHDTAAPYPLPASRFPGIDGYAEVFPGFSTALGTRATDDLRPVPPEAELVFVLVGADEGMAVWNDRGTATMKADESFSLGRAPFDSHPVWNLEAGRSGGPFRLRMLVRDTTGGLADSAVFEPAFAPDDRTEVFVCPMACLGGGYFAEAGRCAACGMALKLLSGRHYRVGVTVEGDAKAAPRAWEPVRLRFQIESPSGEPVQDLEVVHEKLLHLLVVSNDLAWFSHEHPEIQPDGSFLLETTFPHRGSFTLFHDFTPPRVGMQVVAVELQVEGDGEAPEPVPLGPSSTRTRTVDGYSVKLAPPASLMSLVMGDLAVRIERDGAPVTDLQHFLGTLGHLIVISADRKHFVHSHPLPPAAGQEAEAGPEVVFSALFPAPGRYKAWAQFQHEGRVITADFVLDVAAPR